MFNVLFNSEGQIGTGPKHCHLCVCVCVCVCVGGGGGGVKPTQRQQPVLTTRPWRTSLKQLEPPVLKMTLKRLIAENSLLF